MYDVTNKPSHARLNNAEAGQPLSAEIMEQTSLTADVARVVRHRLTELRDRMYGGASAGSSAQPGAPPVADCFSSAWREKFGELKDDLHAIDALSNEIANRF